MQDYLRIYNARGIETRNPISISPPRSNKRKSLVALSGSERSQAEAATRQKSEVASSFAERETRRCRLLKRQ